MQKINLKLLSGIFVCLVLISGCTHIPSTKATQMVRLDNLLYVVLTTERGKSADFIRLYDIEKNKWGRKITIPDANKFVINKMVTNNGSVYLQCKGDWKDNGGIYSINKSGAVDKAVEIEHFESLSGIDNENYYVTEMKYLNDVSNKENSWLFKGAKYNRRTKTRSEYHFDNYQDLIVTDVWEDDQGYWYACFRGGKPQKNNIPEGGLVLVNKSKLDGKLNSYQLDGGNWIFNAKIIGDKDWVWVFRESRDITFNKKYPFAKFSKKNNAFLSATINTDVRLPIITDTFCLDDNYLWFIDSSFNSTGKTKIYRVNKETASFVSMDFSKEIRVTGTAVADNDYLWLDAYKLKSYAPSGNTAPYIMKISKKDMSYDLIYVEPTMLDSIKTIFQNFFSWLLIPFFKG